MADKGSAAVPGGLMVNVRLGETSSAVSVRSRSMAGMLVLVTVIAGCAKMYSIYCDPN